MTEERKIAVFHVNVSLGDGTVWGGVLDAREIVQNIRGRYEAEDLAVSTGSGGGMGAYDADFECWAEDLERCRGIAREVFEANKLTAEQADFTVDEEDEGELPHMCPECKTPKETLEAARECCAGEVELVTVTTPYELARELGVKDADEWGLDALHDYVLGYVPGNTGAADDVHCHFSDEGVTLCNDIGPLQELDFPFTTKAFVEAVERVRRPAWRPDEEFQSQSRLDRGTSLDAFASGYVEGLKVRAYGRAGAGNEAEGDFGTWEDWRRALVEFAQEAPARPLTQEEVSEWLSVPTKHILTVTAAGVVQTAKPEEVVHWIDFADCFDMFEPQDDGTHLVGMFAFVGGSFRRVEGWVNPRDVLDIRLRVGGTDIYSGRGTDH